MKGLMTHRSERHKGQKRSLGFIVSRVAATFISTSMPCMSAPSERLCESISCQYQAKDSD